MTNTNLQKSTPGVALVAVEPSGLAVLDPGMLAGQLAPSSILQYRRDLAHYGAWCAGQGAPPLDAASLARWRAALAGEDSTTAAATINRRLAAVKRLVKEGAAQ